MSEYFYTIHDVNGVRVDDTSENPLSEEEIRTDLKNCAAEKVVLSDGFAAWKIGDDFSGYMYYRVIGNE